MNMLHGKRDFRNSVYQLYDREIILDYLGRPNLNKWVLKNREISWLVTERCGRWRRQGVWGWVRCTSWCPRCQVRCRSPSGSKTSPGWQPISILGPQSYNHKPTSAHTLNEPWSRFSPRELPMRNKLLVPWLQPHGTQKRETSQFNPDFWQWDNKFVSS